MTDEPVHEELPIQHKGRGCFLGGLATAAAFIVSVVVGVFAQSEVFACEFECYSAFAVIAPLLLIALLVGAGLLWRKTPGFLLGIGVTVAITLALVTGCSTLLFVTS